MSHEFRGKGVNITPGQGAGVIACAKHFIGNEQEHFCGGSRLAGQIESSDIYDKTMHELYLWPFAESVQAGVASTMCVPFHSPLSSNA